MKRKDHVGAYEAKTHLPQLLDKVAKGERITITRHGLPIAMLVPVETADKPDPQATIKQLLTFARQHPLDDTSIRGMLEEGRRY